MHLIDLLSKSEFIECNETESIADYLVKQRVITDIQYQHVINAPSQKDKNKFLIECLNENSQMESNEKININGLFINALRYAGCHYIANILDIEETVLVCNHDNDKTRRKGQISIDIQVSALQIKAKELLNRQDSRESQSDAAKSINNNNNNTIWLDKTQFISAAAAGDYRSISNRLSRKKSRGFSFWFCCGGGGGCRKKKSSRIDKNSSGIDAKAHRGDLESASRRARSQVNSEIDKLRQRKIDILQDKSREFYSRLSDRSSIERDALIRYFEQRHQILVFETHYNEAALVVTVICMKRETLLALTALLQSGQLERDCGDLLLSRGLLDALCVKNLRLTVSISPDEIGTALSEFDSGKRK